MKYYGTKKISAEPMTRGDYNKFRGWKLPSGENGDDAGYLVEYLDGGKPNVEGCKGYVSWSPKDVFEEAYKTSGKMNFGHAIMAMKEGKRVGRSGWNGKGMFLYHVPANSYPAQTDVAKAYWGAKQESNDPAVPFVPYGAYIAMKTAQENVVPWLASQTDVLAEDWEVLQEPVVEAEKKSA